MEIAPKFKPVEEDLIHRPYSPKKAKSEHSKFLERELNQEIKYVNNFLIENYSEDEHLLPIKVPIYSKKPYVIKTVVESYRKEGWKIKEGIGFYIFLG